MKKKMSLIIFLCTTLSIVPSVFTSQGNTSRGGGGAGRGAGQGGGGRSMGGGSMRSSDGNRGMSGGSARGGNWGGGNRSGMQGGNRMQSGGSASRGIGGGNPTRTNRTRPTSSAQSSQNMSRGNRNWNNQGRSGYNRNYNARQYGYGYGAWRYGYPGMRHWRNYGPYWGWSPGYYWGLPWGPSFSIWIGGSSYRSSGQWAFKNNLGDAVTITNNQSGDTISINPGDVQTLPRRGSCNYTVTNAHGESYQASSCRDGLIFIGPEIQSQQ